MPRKLLASLKSGNFKFRQIDNLNLKKNSNS